MKKLSLILVIVGMCSAGEFDAIENYGKNKDRFIDWGAILGDSYLGCYYRGGRRSDCARQYPNDYDRMIDRSQRDKAFESARRGCFEGGNSADCDRLKKLIR